MIVFPTRDPTVLRQGTLTSLRWFATAGQFVVLLAVKFGLGFEIPLAPVLVIIAAGIWVNLHATFAFNPARPLNQREVTFYLAFDTVQISSILFLTGGIQNPFALWLIMQSMLAASSLALRQAAIVIALVTTCITILAFFHYPMPWREAEGLNLPDIYKLGLWSALMLGVGFTSAYAWRVAREQIRLNQALTATQLALSREERLSALDGLAAAAAHELGTPLATIQVTAREMERELPDGALKEDASLLISQTQRCQKILRRLSESGADGDAVHNVMSLDALLKEAARPFAATGNKAITFRFDPESGALPERLRRRPEIIYGLRNLIENAVKYCEDAVEVTARWDEERLEVGIADDGPGIPHETLMRLGEPYPRVNPKSDDKGGLGLGFFIAKTLLERTGAKMTYGNRPGRKGAWVALTWPLAKLSVGTTSSEMKKDYEALV
ncbi:MAG: ActS/PrrB/RegB family redox-sensitive histidine kinase [Pseudomonadota bacterium]